MRALGIYFGPKVIALVETDGKKLLNNIQIPLESISAGELEEKVPDEIKLVALFKDELRKNKIAAREAFIALAGKDLVIRTFEMPLLPREELDSAINFEAKKYLPFKPEELILGHQVNFDKALNKNLALLVGIKKEILDKYTSIFGQLNLRLASIEYSAFSILRLLKLSSIGDKGIVVVISADLKDVDEVNFTVLENGFPLFSRDIILSAEQPEEPRAEEAESGMFLEKLKTEVRISLDYYNRKFPTKHIEKVFLISPEDYQQDLEVFLKEMGLVSQFIDVSKSIVKPTHFSLSFFKAYSASLAKLIRIPLKINLASIKVKAEKEVAAAVPLRLDLAALLKGLRIEPRMLILGIFVCIATLGFSLYRRLPLQKEIKDIQALWPPVSTVNPDASYDELVAVDSGYKNKIETVDNLVKKRLYLTSPLDVIPRVIPPGLWLENFSFKKEADVKMQLTLEGMAYLEDSNKEFELVNMFLAKLKEDPLFSANFKEIKIITLDTTTVGETAVTKFEISCKTEPKEIERE